MSRAPLKNLGEPLERLACAAQTVNFHKSRATKQRRLRSNRLWMRSLPRPCTRSRQRVRDQVAHMAFGAETRMRSQATLRRVFARDRLPPQHCLEDRDRDQAKHQSVIVV